MKRMLAGVVISMVAALTGCGEPDSTAAGTVKTSNATGKTASALWSCDTENDAVVCTAALAASESDSAAYVCKAGESAKRCPDAAALGNVDGLDGLLTKGGGDLKAKFESMPWACLVTGQHQFECIRDVARVAGGRKGFGGTDGESVPGGGEAGAGERPAPPEGTCDVATWQAWFAKLATYQFKANGADITFPAEIFDANKSVAEVATEGALPGAGGAGVPAGIPGLPAGIPGIPGGQLPGGNGETPDDSAGNGGGGPSCHAGEWSMRQESWLDIVMANCMGELTNANLTWCQQAANYAPKSGKCTATGTW